MAAASPIAVLYCTNLMSNEIHDGMENDNADTFFMALATDRNRERAERPSPYTWETGDFGLCPDKLVIKKEGRQSAMMVTVPARPACRAAVVLLSACAGHADQRRSGGDVLISQGHETESEYR